MEYMLSEALISESNPIEGPLNLNSKIVFFGATLERTQRREAGKGHRSPVLEAFTGFDQPETVGVPRAFIHTDAD